MTIQLLIADDHEVVRSGLRNLFDGTEICVMAEARSGREALASVSDCPPDVALLDVRMPDGDGLQTLDRIKADFPQVPVVMFSTFDHPTYVARALALGAAGYLLKTADRDAIVSAVRCAARGESLWTRQELQRLRLATTSVTVMPDGDVSLTQRENEVLRHVALGLTNREIAGLLAISYETVKEHVQHILRKLGVADRTQAAVWAVRNGLG